jgi:hypothetical protein
MPLAFPRLIQRFRDAEGMAVQENRSDPSSSCPDLVRVSTETLHGHCVGSWMAGTSPAMTKSDANAKELGNGARRGALRRRSRQSLRLSWKRSAAPSTAAGSSALGGPGTQAGGARSPRSGRLNISRPTTTSSWLAVPSGAGMRAHRFAAGLRRFLMAGQWILPGGGLPSRLMTARMAVRATCPKTGGASPHELRAAHAWILPIRG